jgi:hypothetical protein
LTAQHASELSTAAATVPYSGFIPERVNATALYQYAATESGTAGDSSVHATVEITRTTPTGIAIALKTAIQPRHVFEAMIGADGSLEPFAPNATPLVTPSASPSAHPRARHPVATITDSPVRPPRREEPTIPEPILQLASLLAAVDSEGLYPRTWRYALSSSAVPFVLSLSRNENGTSTTFVADGGGSGNAIHIEATVRGGKFSEARGTLRIVTSNMDQTQATTTTWSLSLGS